VFGDNQDASGVLILFDQEKHNEFVLIAAMTPRSLAAVDTFAANASGYAPLSQVVPARRVPPGIRSTGQPGIHKMNTIRFIK